MEWVKNNSIAVVWMTTAVMLGVATTANQPNTTTLDLLGGGIVALITSAYLSLYLYRGTEGMAYLKRLVPAVVVAVIAIALWYAGFVFPVCIIKGLSATGMSLFVAAVWARVKR
jgi:hypothetical protein